MLAVDPVMAPRSSPELQISEVEIACTLLKKFCKDHGLTATGTAFNNDLKTKHWNTLKTSALARIGIPSLEKLLASHTQQKPRASNDDFNISDSRSLTSVPEREVASDSPQQDQDFAHVRDKHKHLASREHQERRTQVKSLHGSSGTLKRKAAEEMPEADTSRTPAKRTKAKQSQQLGGVSRSTSSASPALDSSSSSKSVSSTSSSSSSDSNSEMDVKQVKKQVKKQGIVVDAEVSSSATSSTSGEDTSSSGDSSDSDSDASTSSSDESESIMSIPSTREVVELKLPKQDDQAASNSSDTVLGDQKTSPESASGDETPQERMPIKAMANIKKHIGARPTPLAQVSAKATPDSHISNAYISYDYAERAYNDLSVTRGKGFTKEKNKKKRGSYRGGAIDISGGKSFKFDD